MGDQCANMAKLVPLLGSEATTDPGIRATIERMGELVRAEVAQAEEAFDTRDVALARDLVSRDGEINRLDRAAFNRAVEIGDDLEVREWAVFMILVARCLERIAARITRPSPWPGNGSRSESSRAVRTISATFASLSQTAATRHEQHLPQLGGSEHVDRDRYDSRARRKPAAACGSASRHQCSSEHSALNLDRSPRTRPRRHGQTLRPILPAGSSGLPRGRVLCLRLVPWVGI